VQPPEEALILLAEDDEHDFCFIQRGLQKSPRPLRLVRVKDGQQAIEYLESKTATMPQLIITDLKMPKINGFELIAWLKKNPATAKIPTVILSGSSLWSDKTRAEALGASGYYVKDGELEVMAAHLAEILERFVPPRQP
jgi:CheY-like chemotaxis protein